MIAENFEYAGEFLKNRGCLICSTDRSSGFEEITSDSKLVFESAKQLNGKLFELTTSHYEDRIELDFCICKDPCVCPSQYFSSDEIREIKRWLNRPTFNKFKLIQPEWSDFYMEGSFNISEIQVNGITCVLKLNFVSNRPFAVHEPITYRFQSTLENNTYSFFDQSDEIGYIHPEIKITCLKSGELQIHNSIENRRTVIKNCTSGEVIMFTSKLLLSTSVPTHKIQNDFNYIHFRIANSYENRINTLTFSLPVKIEIKYSPYVKVVM